MALRKNKEYLKSNEKLAKNLKLHQIIFGVTKYYLMVKNQLYLFT